MAVDASIVRCEDPAAAFRLTSPSPPPPPYSLCNAFSPKLRAPRRLSNAGACGFSAGDFLSAVSLLRDLIHALHDSSQTSREHEQLIAELQSLDTAILQAEAHYGGLDSPAQRIVLDQAIQACQQSVNDFLSSVSKPHRDSSSHGSGNVVRDVFPKKRWSMITTEELVAFRCCISAHVHSIQTLLVTIQV